MVRLHLVISGVVQGVGFRQFTAKKANELNIVGWVRNLADGRVELLAEGDDVDMDQLDRWCDGGPPHAVVNAKEQRERTQISTLTFTAFEIRHST